MNWYVYCGNSPVMLVDSSGLFGENTKLAYNPVVYSEDVRKLQNELAWNGYLRAENVNGYFDIETYYAVNQYKEDNGLLNTGNYEGVVGITTWEHLGLEADYKFEVGGTFDTPGVKGRGCFVQINGPSITNGLMLGSFNAGMMQYGGDYKYGRWEVEAVSGEAALGFTKDFIGAELEANLISAEGGVRFPIPFTDKQLYIGGEGNLIGIGVKAQYENGKITIGATALLGVGLTIGIE